MGCIDICMYMFFTAQFRNAESMYKINSFIYAIHITMMGKLFLNILHSKCGECAG